MWDGYQALETLELMSGFSFFASTAFAFDQCIDVDAEIFCPPINVLSGILELGIVVWT